MAVIIVPHVLDKLIHLGVAELLKLLDRPSHRV